jgi:hypothetical protein
MGKTPPGSKNMKYGLMYKQINCWTLKIFKIFLIWGSDENILFHTFQGELIIAGKRGFPYVSQGRYPLLQYLKKKMGE